MDLTFNVRRIAPQDGRLLADVRLRALAEAPYAFHTTVADASGRSGAEWAEAARRNADGNHAATFFAELDGAAVGMAGGYFDDDPRVANLVSMWVASECRRSGVGRALIEAVVGWARDAGAGEVQLIVLEGNEPAYRLYESAGFAVSPTGPPRSERRMERPL